MRTEPANMTDDLVGTVLLGRYRVVRELAKGGMGVVYLARAEGAVGFVKPVVIKLVLPEHASDERFLGMFVREAQILARLRHPSIVDVLEFGEENGAYVMVLEYVRGYHLGQWNKYLRKLGREIPTEVLLLLMIDVLEALHNAHSMTHPDGTPMHIVHRDVSPSNILLDEDGRARLLDFGVARMRGGNVDYQTQVKSFVGKLTYSAPEMFAGVEATPQSDVYSCGVVMHEMLFGRNVFSGKNQATTLNLVLNHIPEPLEGLRPDIPAGIDAILRKAMSKSPDERFASAREFATALRGLQREHESEVRGRFAAMLKEDFGEEMARMLGIESLTARDEAWRRLSVHPPADGDNRTMAIDLEEGGLPEMHATRAPMRTRANTLRGPAVAPSATSTGSMPRVQTTGRMPRVTTGNLPRINVPPPPGPMPPPVIHAAPAPAHGTNRLLLFGLVVVGSLALVAIIVSLRGQPVQSAVAAPAIRVVAEPDTPPPVVEPAQGPIVEPVDAPEPPEQESVKRPRAASRPSGPDPASLTRAFRKQQSRIEGCFKQHTVSIEGLPRMQLEFDLDASGKALSVQVTPKSVSGTPLGQCLRDVGNATRFPAQGQPVSFAIPITASRGTGG